MVGSVLIIGDQNRQGQEMRQVLKKDTHFSTRIVASNGASLKTAIEADPDIIVLNPKGSYLDSMDLYYAMRKEAPLQDTPIVLLLDEAEMRSADLPSGIQEVLFRPLRPEEAAARLKLLLKRVRKTDQKDIMSRGKLTLDLAKYEVRVSDKKIDLTFTEFELLRFLCSHPGTVFTREVLLNKVWGYEYYGGTRTVDVHIRRLRSKIEGRTLHFIDTVRNIGYKFISEE